MTNNYDSSEARRFYQDCPNFMTPDPIAYKTTPSYYVELAKGYCMGSYMYGVTVREKADNIKDADDPEGLSKSFFNEAEAREYYRNIW